MAHNLDTQVIDGEVWVKYQDILDRVAAAADLAMDMAEKGNLPYLAIQAHGIAELGSGLQVLLDKLRTEHGLT